MAGVREKYVIILLLSENSFDSMMTERISVSV